MYVIAPHWSCTVTPNHPLVTWWVICSLTHRHSCNLSPFYYDTWTWPRSSWMKPLVSNMFPHISCCEVVVKFSFLQLFGFRFFYSTSCQHFSNVCHGHPDQVRDQCVSQTHRTGPMYTRHIQDWSNVGHGTSMIPTWQVDRQHEPNVCMLHTGTVDVYHCHTSWSQCVFSWHSMSPMCMYATQKQPNVSATQHINRMSTVHETCVHFGQDQGRWFICEGDPGCPSIVGCGCNLLLQDHRKGGRTLKVWSIVNVMRPLNHDVTLTKLSTRLKDVTSTHKSCVGCVIRKIFLCGTW